jgi:small-conductance mechanosensitive channel
LAVALLLLPGEGRAQWSALPNTSRAASSDTGTAGGASLQGSADAAFAAELDVKLAAERAQLELLDTPGGLSAGAPPGTDEESLRLRHIRVVFIVRTLEQQRSDLARLAANRARRSALEQELATWKGLPEKPPYSILLADRIRSEMHGAETTLEGLKSRRALLQQTAERARERVKLTQQQLRQLSEQAETASRDGATAQIIWQREQTRLMLRVAETAASAVETGRQLLDEEQAVAKLEVDLARRKLDLVAADLRFTPEDMEQVRRTLAAESDKLAGKEIDNLTRERTRRQTALEAALQALEAARAGPQPADGSSPQAPTGHLPAFEREVELQRARLHAVEARLESLGDAWEFHRARVALWESRYAVHQSGDASARLALRDNAGKLIEYLRLQKNFLEQQNRSAEAAAMEVESRRDLAPTTADKAFLEALKDAHEERAAGIRHTLAAVDANMALARQILAESGGDEGPPRSMAERWADWGVIAANFAAAVWNFELLAVEDSIQVDGKTIAGTRSVTVGKVLLALFMLIAGYLLAVFLARQGERLLVRKLGWQAAHAGIVGRWLLAAEVVLLFVLVLAWVKIPFTIFAFLGGAVAIGLGFGMQTLLKNLISGLMILGEKPFRIGDLVEIGGIRGTVTNIGLRASTVNDVNGIETVIPNSTFIEQNLTNWTLTSGRVRFNIKVGVAYGSPVRSVIRHLEEVAARHGQVLKEPHVEVLLEDFGNDALIFGLYYWLDISSGTVARQVASDLRSMIEGSFTDHGIVFAFPQRDVHLDATLPLPVRLVPAAAAEPGGAGAPRPQP